MKKLNIAETTTSRNELRQTEKEIMMENAINNIIGWINIQEAKIKEMDEILKDGKIVTLDKQNNMNKYKDFKEFLQTECWDLHKYGNGKYDKKIYDWFMKATTTTKEPKEECNHIFNYEKKTEKCIKCGLVKGVSLKDCDCYLDNDDYTHTEECLVHKPKPL